jgi:hypothetical protein
MRGIGSVLGLLIAMAIGLGIYKIYFAQQQATTGAATPTHTIDTVGVQNDLIAIAQAERLYQAQHSSYASLDELSTSGAMSIAKSGRDGYTYEVQTSDSSYRVIAHCPTATTPRCANYSVDDTMQVQTATQ